MIDIRKNSHKIIIGYALIGIIYCGHYYFDYTINFVLLALIFCVIATLYYLNSYQ